MKNSPGQHGVVGCGRQMSGDVERGRCCSGRGCGGRRDGCARVLVVVQLAAAASGFVLAEYARDGERRVRRRGRLDRGGRFAAAAVGRVARAGGRRGVGRATSVGRAAAAAAVAAGRPRVVVVVVAGHVDARRLGHGRAAVDDARAVRLATEKTEAEKRKLTGSGSRLPLRYYIR